MKDPIEIPIPEDTPSFTQRITLDGVEFSFLIFWSDRESRWYLSIFTVDLQPLATGIKLVADWPLLRTYSDPRLPKGVLIGSDMSPQGGESPTYTELGTRVRLMYFGQ